MFGTAGRFVYGMFAELVWLALVLAAAGLSADFFGRAGGGSSGELLVQLALFGGYAALVLVPARNVAQGWLGMLGGHRPPAYDEPADDLGRALADVAFVVGFGWVLVHTFGAAGDSASVEALTFAYCLFTLLVFGVGGAVPHLYFGFRRRAGAAHELPDVLRQAGRQASWFCVCAFFAVGLGLAVARRVAAARALPPPAPHAIARPRPVARAHAEPAYHEEFIGRQCTGATCTDERLDVNVPYDGPLTIHYRALEDEPPCAALVSVGTAPPTREVGETTVLDVERGAVVRLWMFMTENLTQCGYHLVFDQSPKVER